MKMTLNEEIEYLQSGNWYDKVRAVLPTDEYLKLGWAIGDILETLELFRSLAPEPQTNADRIRAMDDGSLLDFFVEASGDLGCPPNEMAICDEFDKYGRDACRKCWDKYLKSPVEEG